MWSSALVVECAPVFAKNLEEGPDDRVRSPDVVDDHRDEIVAEPVVRLVEQGIVLGREDSAMPVAHLVELLRISLATEAAHGVSAHQSKGLSLQDRVPELLQPDRRGDVR